MSKIELLFLLLSIIWSNEYIIIILLSNYNIWYIIFSVEEFTNYAFKRDYGVWVRHDGLVHWSYAGLFSTVCILNLQKYPFDEHNCSINIESWLYNATELDFRVIGAHIDSQVKSLLNHLMSATWTNNFPIPPFLIRMIKTTSFVLFINLYSTRKQFCFHHNLLFIWFHIEVEMTCLTF